MLLQLCTMDDAEVIRYQQGKLGEHMANKLCSPLPEFAIKSNRTLPIEFPLH